MSDVRTEALARTIACRLPACSRDELRVVDAVLLRLELGRERYGLLDLAKPRDWDREQAEELVDALVYRACGTIVDHDARLRSIYKRIEAPVVAGLVELRDAIAVRSPAGLPFDMSDLPMVDEPLDEPWAFAVDVPASVGDQ